MLYTIQYDTLPLHCTSQYFTAHCTVLTLLSPTPCVVSPVTCLCQSLCTDIATTRLKGTTTQNNFSLKVIQRAVQIRKWQWFTKIIRTKRRQLNWWYVWAPEAMSPRFSGAKSALLHNSAGQRTKSPWFCGAKNEGSVISRGKVCIAP